VTFAMFRVMALALWRDRAALAMAFVLPPLVFLIFSAVFAGVTAETLSLKVAAADDAHTANSARLMRALVADPQLKAEPMPSFDAVRRAVRSGHADAGLVIRGDPAGPGSPLVILADSSRAMAAPIVEARAREVMTRAAPDLLLTRTLSDVAPATGPLTTGQKLNVEMAVQELQDDPGAAAKTAPLFTRTDVVGAKKGVGVIAYYAGAVMILFALFSAAHGAVTLIDERRAGIADRILAGRAGMGPVVTGKFLFLAAQGALQAVAIFATAQIVYGVPVTQHLGLWLATTMAAAAASAGLALGLVALCRTREQAQMLSTFVILVLAAIGGSMAPRFLMPDWLQRLGWATPHAWVIDAYQGLLWRDAGADSLYRPWLVLAAIGLGGFIIAQAAARRVRL
jgi:ABC-2 type transport system permease protein